MSESKQEARLPERIENALREALPIGETSELRLAILAALDEARDEALDEAAELCDDTYITSATCAKRIRALKSKQGA